ncbi:ADP-ribosylglycohydrolase family protein [Spirosoma knui]
MVSKIKGAFLGTAIGDALGVPVEFKSRDYLRSSPITDYIGYGTWNQPPGTFSDDSSLVFCTAESLCNGFDLSDIATRFIRWAHHGYWGAHDTVFDIGNATSEAIDRLHSGTSPKLSGGMAEFSNGNGSLMRILPIVFHLRNVESVNERFEVVKLVSGITHQHVRSVISCFIYVELCSALFTDVDKLTAYENAQQTINQFIATHKFSPEEIALFDRLLKNNISLLSENEIRSSGYVIDTLESSIWCFLTTSTYSSAVLKAVNLGGDTDTTGAVTGGLAGLYYSDESIPAHWIQGLAKHQEISELAERFAQSCV